MPPTIANGKICYIEMPSADIARSADFYRKVFGWNIRKRGDGATSFDDASRYAQDDRTGTARIAMTAPSAGGTVTSL